MKNIQEFNDGTSKKSNTINDIKWMHQLSQIRTRAMTKYYTYSLCEVIYSRVEVN